MAADFIATSAGLLLFPLFGLVPGYVCGWFIDALGFRQRTPLARVAISIPLSIGISPILAYLLWHWSLLAVWAVFGAVWIAFLGLLLRERRRLLRRPALSKGRIAFLAITAGWIVLGMFCVIDLQFGNRLYFPLIAYDYTLRTAITAAITRSGIPPHNPYFFPGQPVFLRYHYFWFIPCSLLSQLAKTLITPRQAMLSGTLWSGVGLIALIPLYLRFFQPKGAINLERRMLIGVGLLSAAGLNVLPIALLDVFGRRLFLTDTEVAPWISEVLWAPHHVAALVACLIGFLLLWYCRDSPGAFDDLRTSLVAGIVFASAVGLSVYVAFVFAVFLAAWAAVSSFRKQFREAALLCAAGIVACVLSAPYLFELLGGHSNQSAGGGRFLQFTVRAFPISDIFISRLQALDGWPVPVVNALALPLNYLLALGFFLFVGLLQWKRMRARRNFFGHRELCGFMLATVSILLCTFLRSGVIASNDLGKRGIMVAQFMLLIWGTEFLSEIPLTLRENRAAVLWGQLHLNSDLRYLLLITLALGLAGTINDLFVLRFLPIVADAAAVPMLKWLSPDHNLGKRTYALREFYENLNDRLPQTAVMQHNPDTDPGDLPYGLYADHQLAAETLGCGTVFGGDPASCAPIIRRIDDLFETPRIAETADIDKTCKDLSINVLIAQDTDAVWSDKKSWVWKRKPMLANAYARAYLCGR